VAGASRSSSRIDAFSNHFQFASPSSDETRYRPVASSATSSIAHNLSLLPAPKNRQTERQSAPIVAPSTSPLPPLAGRNHPNPNPIARRAKRWRALGQSASANNPPPRAATSGGSWFEKRRVARSLKPITAAWSGRRCCW